MNSTQERDGRTARGRFLAGVDLTDDGVVDGQDLTVILSAWGDCP